MKRDFNIRLAGRGDLPALGRIFFRAIRLGARGKYSYSQRRAWADHALSRGDLMERLNGHSVVAAVDRQNLPIGFMTLSSTGYIDLAFVAPEYIGTGVSRLLFAAIETIAFGKGLSEFTAHASLMAEPVFSKFGFEVVQRETKTVRGVQLDRFEMRKAPI